MVVRVCCLLAAIIALSSAATISFVQTPVLARISEGTLDPAPQYSFAYDVQDALTGDSKAHVENRNGDVVQGQYSLNDPDGTRRIVDYTADPVNGFNAVVRRASLVAVAEPLAARSVAEPLVARAVAAPLVARVTAPVKAEKFEDDSVAVEAVPVTNVEDAPAGSPAVVGAAPRVVAAARIAQAPYVAAPVLAYRFAAPFTYAIV